MQSQIKLGKVFGITIGLHYSWFIIAFLIVLSISQRFHAANAGWSEGFILTLSVATGILFFVSLLLHELAHSLVAKSRGIPVREITLFALGGVSNIEKGATSAKTEFWIAVVGPLMSAGIGAICIGLQALTGRGSSAAVMLSWLGYINLALAGFNLIPGYPLDGGRILRAAIWWKTGDVDGSTRTASKVGQAVGFIFIAMGIFQFFAGAGFGGLWLAFIGWFLLQAAGASYLEVGVSRALKGVTVADAMTPNCPAVDGNLSIQEFVDEILLRTATRCVIVLDNSGLAGLVTPHEVKEIDRARWPFTRLFDIMRPLDEVRTVEPGTPLKTALEIMGRRDLNQLPVVASGKVTGVVSRAEVLNYLHNRMQLQA